MDLNALILADYARFQAIFPDYLPQNFSDLDPEVQAGFAAGYNQLVNRLIDLGFGNINSLGFGTVVPGIPTTPFDTSNYHPWRDDPQWGQGGTSSTPASQGG